jgi:hypothetical protein
MTDENEDCCMVCGYDDYEDNNKIMYCEVCDISLHQTCYGLSHMNQAEVQYLDFTCWPCRILKTKERSLGLCCVICNQRGGALIPSNLEMAQLLELSKKDANHVSSFLRKATSKNNRLTNKEVLRREKQYAKENGRLSGVDSPEKEGFKMDKKKSNQTYSHQLRSFQKKNQNKKTQTCFAWVHVNCSFWVMSGMLSKQHRLNLARSDTALQVVSQFFKSPVSWTDFGPQLMSAFCEFCSYSNWHTPKIKCAYAGCERSFHGECARLNGV